MRFLRIRRPVIMISQRISCVVTRLPTEANVLMCRRNRHARGRVFNYLRQQAQHLKVSVRTGRHGTLIPSELHQRIIMRSTISVRFTICLGQLRGSQGKAQPRRVNGRHITLTLCRRPTIKRVNNTRVGQRFRLIRQIIKRVFLRGEPNVLVQQRARVLTIQRARIGGETWFIRLLPTRRLRGLRQARSINVRHARRHARANANGRN